MPSKPKTQPANLDKYKKDYESWVNYSRSHKITWDQMWQLYYGRRVKYNYRGDGSDTVDPMVYQMIESGVDNVYGTRPEATFEQTHRDQETDTKLLNGMWYYTWDANRMDNRIIPIGRETKITGNSAIWCEPADGYLKFIHKPWRDCFFDPAGLDEDTIRFGGYVGLYDIEELKAMKVFDKDKGEWVDRYTDLDKITPYSQLDDRTDKQVKDAYKGSTLPDDGRDGQAFVIRMFYKNKIVELANLGTVIREDDNPWRKDAYTVQIPLYDETLVPDDIENTPDALKAFFTENPDIQVDWQDVEVAEIESFIPVALNRRIIDPSQLIARGDVEPIADQAELLNDMINAKVDVITAQPKGLTVYDSSRPGNNGLDKKLGNFQPGDIVGVDGGPNAVSQVRPDNGATVGIESEINRIKQSIRDTSRIDQVVQGVTAETKKTATEINSQMAQATGGFATEIRGLETGLYYRLGMIFVRWMQIFLDEKTIVRVMGRDGVEWKDYDPNKFWGLYEVKMTLETRAAAKRGQEADRAMQMYKMFASDPSVNTLELKKMVAKKVFEMDADDIEMLFTPPAPPAGMAMGAGQMAGAPMAPPMGGELGAIQ